MENINGIDVSSFLAEIGILGVILGLAIQDWLKDIIRGISILSDNYFSVGDIVISIMKNDNAENCICKGINELADSRINYLIEILCNTIYKLQIKKDALKCILLTMEKHKFIILYKQIDIHNRLI